MAEKFIWIPLTLWKRIKELSKRFGLSWQELVREAVEEYAENHKKKQEILESSD